MSSAQRIKITSHSTWLELRKRDLTASTMGALFGVHPYYTIAGLHALKCGVDLGGPDLENEAVQRGHDLEPVAAKMAKRQRPEWRITKAREYLRDTDARLGATPDFYITANGRRGVLQVKSVGYRKWQREWFENEGPPFWIVLQNLQEAMLDGADFGAIAALAHDEYHWQLHIYDVDRNAAAERRIRQAAAGFWEAVDAGQVPQLDYKRDGELIKLMYAHEVKGKVVDLTQNNRVRGLLDARELQASIIKDAKAEKDAVEAELRAIIGDAEAAIVPNWKVTLKTTHVSEQVHQAYEFRSLRTIRVPE